MSTTEEEQQEKQIQQWRVKNLIKSLEKARGNGTSMISLIIPPKGQVALIQQKLTEEYGTASNIKSRVNRLSVLGAITSTQQRLKLYNRIPDNGLVIYCGTVITDEGKEKKVARDFEPFKPINTSLYLCDNKFHTEPLRELLEDDDKFGFIVMDGSSTLFGTLSGNSREVLHKLTVELPKKHGRGGQSALRFARLRLEKRHNYLRKVTEVATQMFIANDRPTVSGLVLAGLADFKNELSQTDMFDPRLKKKVIKIVDVSYGGENGFNQAIELASDALKDVKFVKEKRLIGNFMDQLARDTGRYSIGLQETLAALEMSAVETLIVWEGLELERVTYRNSTSGEAKTLILSPQQKEDPRYMKETDGSTLEIEDSVHFLEWLAENYTKFGAHLEFVSDKSEEGNQFVKGFGGVGAILRYQVDNALLQSTGDDLGPETGAADDAVDYDDWDL